MNPRDEDTKEKPSTTTRRTGDDRAVVRLQRRRTGQSVDPEFHETVQGSRPGSRFLRLTRASEQKLRRVSEGAFEATAVASRPQTAAGRAWAGVRHFLLGRALATSELGHERLSKFKALAIFSSDHLSSSAYATEEILLVLILAGTGALTNSVPIALAIAALAAIVASSYTQLVKAYPDGGGAYAVTKENLGTRSSLLTGSTLFVDYILTVAVSTAAGVAAITSALPELADYRLEIALVFVTLLTLSNLRGIRESGSLFALPPYFFILTFGGMLVVGLIRIAVGSEMTHVEPADAIEGGAQGLTLILLLRAFAAGAVALTGIEAIAEGVPAFKPPEARNASITLIWMAAILSLFFVGTTLLAHQLDVVPSESKTVVAQIAQTVFGQSSPFFYAVQVSTAMILVLAANTAFAGLPTLASVMAKDGSMPKRFAFRGDRLAFTNGIIVLGVLSAGVLVIFSASTHKIIPLYAFGVFTAFTLSQAGMVLHWKRSGQGGWKLAVTLVGAIVTATVAVIVGATRFVDGVWVSISAMLVLFGVLWVIRAHYSDAERQLGRGLTSAVPVADYFYSVSAGRPQTVIVPVDEINRAVLQTVAYARTLSTNATAIHVTDEREKADLLRAQWEESVPDVPLVVVDSPYRSIVEPIMAYIDAMDRAQPNQMVTVVLPEFVPKYFWQHFLHNQLSSRLKRALVDRRNTVVVDVPYHLL